VQEEKVSSSSSSSPSKKKRNAHESIDGFGRPEALDQCALELCPLNLFQRQSSSSLIEGADDGEDAIVSKSAMAHDGGNE
jgi:hypothetical protein